MKISTIIIDDEPLARSMIKDLLSTRQEFEILGESKTGKEAINMINKFEPDLIFLDIKLKDMTGFDVIETIIASIPIIIFTTAYKNYSLKAFDYFAFDYLLKPFNEVRFYKSINKVLENFKSKNNTDLKKKLNSFINYITPTENSNSTYLESIPIPQKGKTVFVNQKDIQYVLAANCYVEVYTINHKYLLRSSLSEMTSRLNSVDFIRVHRSSIINVRSIKELINSPFGEIDIKMTDKKRIKVSRSYKKEFLKKTGIK